MKFLDNLTKRVTKTAGETVSEEVKKQVKDDIPVAIGIGLAIFGIASFFGGGNSGVKELAKVYPVQTINNTFLIANEELLADILKGAIR